MTAYDGFCLLCCSLPLLFFNSSKLQNVSTSRYLSLVFVVPLLFYNSAFNPVSPDSYRLLLGIGKVISGNLPREVPNPTNCFCFTRNHPKAAIIATGKVKGGETEIQGECPGTKTSRVKPPEISNPCTVITRLYLKSVNFWPSPHGPVTWASLCHGMLTPLLCVLLLKHFLHTGLRSQDR